MKGAAPAMAAASVEAPGWQARLALGFELRAGRTVLARRARSGPLAVQRPFYPEDATCHAYLLHPPGGVVGGDRLEVTIEVDRGAAALVTTPGAAKYYRSAGATARQSQRLRVADGASLEWLPQENILFQGADVRLDTEVRLQSGARFLGWEIHCLGRPASAERFAPGRSDVGLRVYRDDRPLLLERLRIEGEPTLNGPARLRGAPVTATWLAVPADRASLQTVRDALHQYADVWAGATLLDDLLVVRLLGGSTERAHGLFRGLWQALRAPLLGRPPCPPRIWAT